MIKHLKTKRIAVGLLVLAGLPLVVWLIFSSSVQSFTKPASDLGKSPVFVTVEAEMQLTGSEVLPDDPIAWPHRLSSLDMPSHRVSPPTFSTGLSGFLSELEAKNTQYKWTDLRPRDIPWEYHRTTAKKRPLMFVHYGKGQKDCILFLGAVHGDELPTVYLMFRLAHYIQDHPELVNDRCIVIAPLVNPDGFLAARPTRVNANGVDVNRNFPTRNWQSDAHRSWANRSKNPRYNPGSKAGSETETLFQVALINRFKPQKILSAHSPLNLYDYDGPSTDLDSFEQWMERISKASDNHPVKKFGVFPGSLGNYAGRERNIFTLTLELPTSDPSLGAEYFDRFQPAFLKFISMPVVGTPPNARLVKN